MKSLMLFLLLGLIATPIKAENKKEESVKSEVTLLQESVTELKAKVEAAKEADRVALQDYEGFVHNSSEEEIRISEGLRLTHVQKAEEYSAVLLELKEKEKALAEAKKKEEAKLDEDKKSEEIAESGEDSVSSDASLLAAVGKAEYESQLSEIQGEVKKLKDQVTCYQQLLDRPQAQMIGQQNMNNMMPIMMMQLMQQMISHQNQTMASFTALLGVFGSMHNSPASFYAQQSLPSAQSLLMPSIMGSLQSLMGGVNIHNPQSVFMGNSMGAMPMQNPMALGQMGPQFPNMGIQGGRAPQLDSMNLVPVPPLARGI